MRLLPAVMIVVGALGTAGAARADEVVAHACSDVKAQVKLVSDGVDATSNAKKVVVEHTGADKLSAWCIVEGASGSLRDNWKRGDRNVVCYSNSRKTNAKWYVVVARTSDVWKSIPMQERTKCGEKVWALVKELERKVGNKTR